MNVWLIFHILGVVMFLGNIVTAAFWKIRAELGGSVEDVYKAVRSVMIADYFFTVPGVAFILVSGHAMAEKAGYDLFSWSWIGVSYVLFILTGAIWAVVLLPAQLKMIRAAKQSLAESRLNREYGRWSSIWNGFGTLATLIPIGILILMVLKP